MVWILLICATASLVYGPSLRFFFSQDDFVFLARAASITSWEDLARLFTAPDHFYRPVPRVAMFVAQLRLFGLNAQAFHLVSLGFHTLNAVLLFLLCRRLHMTKLLAGLSGLLYISHPVSFLAVYWVSGIQDLCVTVFVLFSLLLHIHSAETQNCLWWAFSLLMYGLALLSKEMAATFPILFILVESTRMWQTGRRPGLRHIARRSLGYGVLLGFYLLVRSRKATSLISSEGPYAWNFAPRTVLGNLCTYFCDTLYICDWLRATPHRAMWVCLLLLTALVVLFWRSRRSRPVITLGIGWFLLSLSPVLFLSQQVYSFYAYLPLVGMVMVLASLVSALLEGIRHQVHRLDISRQPIFHLAKGVLPSLLLAIWLWFSASQIRATEAKDPAGIISKSVLARRAITDVQALCPELPAESTLYVVGLTDRDVWAFGHGDLFRLYYPQAKIVLVPEGEEGQSAMMDAKNDCVYRPGGGE
jgi:hypothetical protein